MHKQDIPDILYSFPLWVCSCDIKLGKILYSNAFMYVNDVYPTKWDFFKYGLKQY